MKPPRRYIFNTLTIVSLLCLMGTAGLWLRGYFVADAYSWQTGTNSLNFMRTGSGRFEAGSWTTTPIPTNAAIGAKCGVTNPPGYARRKLSFSRWFRWFDYVHSNQPVSSGLIISLPHWFLNLIYAVIPIIWLYNWIRLRKRTRKLGPNACPACSYDLTGNETGGCPECGDGRMSS